VSERSDNDGPATLVATTTRPSPDDPDELLSRHAGPDPDATSRTLLDLARAHADDRPHVAVRACLHGLMLPRGESDHWQAFEQAARALLARSDNDDWSFLLESELESVQRPRLDRRRIERIERIARGREDVASAYACSFLASDRAWYGDRAGALVHGSNAIERAMSNGAIAFAANEYTSQLVRMPVSRDAIGELDNARALARIVGWDAAVTWSGLRRWSWIEVYRCGLDAVLDHFAPLLADRPDAPKVDPMSIYARAGLVERFDERWPEVERWALESGMPGRIASARETLVLRLAHDPVRDRDAELVELLDRRDTPWSDVVGIEVALASMRRSTQDEVAAALARHAAEIAATFDVTGTQHATPIVATVVELRAAAERRDPRSVRTLVDRLEQQGFVALARTCWALTCATIARRLDPAHPVCAPMLAEAANRCDHAGCSAIAEALRAEFPAARRPDAPMRDADVSVLRECTGSNRMTLDVDSSLAVEDELVVVLEGLVAVMATDSDAPVDLLGRGDVLVFAPARLLAMSGSELLRIEGPLLRERAARDVRVQVALRTARATQARRRSAQQRRTSLPAHDLRVFELLEQLRVQDPELRLTHQRMARLCNTRRVTVTQAIGRLRAVGAVSARPGRPTADAVAASR
jgi:CRP-like cAMP-binding protein